MRFALRSVLIVSANVTLVALPRIGLAQPTLYYPYNPDDLPTNVDTSGVDIPSGVLLHASQKLDWVRRDLRQCSGQAQGIAAALKLANDANTADNARGAREAASSARAALGQARSSLRAAKSDLDEANHDVVGYGLRVDSRYQSDINAVTKAVDDLDRNTRQAEQFSHNIRTKYANATMAKTTTTRSSVAAFDKGSLEALRQKMAEKYHVITGVQAAKNAADNGEPSGVQLLAAADTYSGNNYTKPGFQCTDLVNSAAHDLNLNTRPAEGQWTQSTTWFNRGMGDDFKQVGGPDGESMSQLIAEAHSPTSDLKIGTIIVAPGATATAEGHAAIFAGTGFANNKPIIFVLDANGYDRAWHLNFYTGQGGFTSVPNSVEYPGKSTGLHAVPGQWNPKTLVKAFYPAKSR